MRKINMKLEAGISSGLFEGIVTDSSVIINASFQPLTFANGTKLEIDNSELRYELNYPAGITNMENIYIGEEERTVTAYQRDYLIDEDILNMLESLQKEFSNTKLYIAISTENGCIAISKVSSSDSIIPILVGPKGTIKGLWMF